jgi:hypothetical protein
MVKRDRKPREKWAPKREPDAPPVPLQPPDHPSYPFLKHVHDNPRVGDRLWLMPDREAEPSLDHWIAALIAADQRNDQGPLTALLKSDQPLQQHARTHLADFIDRHQQRGAVAPVLRKLQSDIELSRRDRTILANLLDQPWTKTKGNRSISYEISTENIALDHAVAQVDSLRNQGTDLKTQVEELTANGLSFEQVYDRVRDQTWTVKDVALRDRVNDLKFKGLKPTEINNTLIGEGWIRNNETIKEALSHKSLPALIRQSGWVSKVLTPQNTTVGKAAELELGDVPTLKDAVDRLTRQHWSVADAVNRVSKWCEVPSKTLLSYHKQGGRSWVRVKLPRPKKK